MVQAVALWGCKVNPGKRVPAYDDDDASGAFHLTMAAIDSSDKSSKLSTIKVIRRPKICDDDDENNHSGDVSESDLKELEVEFVLCTLKHGDQYQQSLNLTFSEDEEVFFTTSGDCPVYLTGNYVVPSDIDDDYDISSDELFDKYSEASDVNGSESDELDGDSPKIEELSSSESKISDSEKKISLSDDGSDLDNIISNDSAKKNIKKRPQDNSDLDMQKLSKKQLKKLKSTSAKFSQIQEKNKSNTSMKQDSLVSSDLHCPKPSVSFAKDIDQDSNKASKSRTLEGGVTVEDKVIGKGPQVKNGSKIGVRYIGKLLTGEQFDSNTKGQPFVFTLGKGWDIGIKGMALGGQRRIVVPSSMAYGKKSVSGIPANSDLVFDIKLVKMN
ncbi:uncharacterized protein T551_01709 [Pneumocystis jirovecii RU7]|uniref:FK506-binding protein n=1 Tax=Pneumocystis jirovecii (strain RU7) TaxID=1408657 RepID=A0A0W4ZPX4_PNEJ7|nr:uncharacterized protein T551_01709 [Pneumocystis jirovecii RU7]KTW30426.1 hypothetical protein T551_01709 [Pneumocystis jirovecii RU7]